MHLNWGRPTVGRDGWGDARLGDHARSPVSLDDGILAVGDVLRASLAARRDVDATVLCGHTHGGGEARILPNLTVLTGEADYGAPVVRVIDV